MDPTVLAKRLPLGRLRAPTPASGAAAAGDHGHSEDDPRYVRRRFLTAESARATAVQIANATAVMTER